VVELPDSVRQSFVAAGWQPERQVAVPSSVPAEHPAAAIVAALGGLNVVPNRKSGEECAPNDLAFREVTLDDYINVWATLLGTLLVGIAEVHDGHGELYVATDGRCFGRSCIHDAFYFEGQTFADAVERSLLGRRVRPMLLPDQPSVSLYGIQYTPDSPKLYRYT
jgi:SUKH-3 immunity protein